MSVVIRMRRTGAKGRPFYRVVVADSRYARDGRYIEQLGYYDPLTDPAKFIIDAAKFEMWIRRGAQPSESVEVMMEKHAPAALRPAPLPAIESQEPPAAAPKAPKAKKAKKAKAAPKSKAKAASKPAKTTKGSEKKKKTKAKAKARKASGIAKPKKTKKAKSKK